MSEHQPPEELNHNLMQVARLETVGRAAAGIAHDLNNVLTIVLSCAELLAADPLTAGQRNELALVVDAARRGSTLTGRLLALSRGRALDTSAVELRQVVRDLEPLLACALGPGVELSFELGDMPSAVLGGAGHLDQLLLNLALNARDAMPEGGSFSISLSSDHIDPRHPLAARLRAGEHAVLCVADTGVGMDDAIRARAFEPFFTTKGEKRGTGLGLGVVRDVIHDLGGAVTVESTPGDGTTFRLYIPLALGDALPSYSGQETVPVVPKPKAASRCLPQTAPPCNDARRPQGRSDGFPKVLVVEDEEGQRHSLMRLLEEADLRPLEAKSALHALQILREHEVHAVVTDQFMPGMDGVQLLELVLRQFPETGRVLLTGHASPDVIINAVNKARVARVLIKTMHPTALRDEISAVAIESYRGRG